MSTGETIFWGFVGFLSLLAILVFLRLLLRKHPPDWKQLRLGVYIERVPSQDDDWEDELVEVANPVVIVRPEDTQEIKLPPQK